MENSIFGDFFANFLENLPFNLNLGLNNCNEIVNIFLEIPLKNLEMQPFKSNVVVFII